MTEQRYWRLSLLLPPGVGLLALGLAITGGMFWERLDYFWFLTGALAYFGVPYTCFAIAVFVWTAGKAPSELRRLSYVLPLLYVPVLWATDFALRRAYHQTLTAEEWRSTFQTLGALGLVNGYAFVALAHGGLLCLRRRACLTAGP